MLLLTRLLLGACVSAVSLCTAAGEIVTVKYRGPVDLAGFDCKESPQSSLVWRTCYDAPHQYLIVNLKGTYYHYCRMPANAVSAWRSDESLGKHFLKNIKGQYDCRSGGVPN